MPSACRSSDFLMPCDPWNRIWTRYSQVPARRLRRRAHPANRAERADGVFGDSHAALMFGGGQSSLRRWSDRLSHLAQPCNPPWQLQHFSAQVRRRGRSKFGQGGRDRGDVHGGVARKTSRRREALSRRRESTPRVTAKRSSNSAWLVRNAVTAGAVWG